MESSTLAAVPSTNESHHAAPPPIAKGVAFVLVGIVAIHFAITFLWNAPSNPIRDALGGQVNGYMEPFFEQNWSLFAPNPVNTEDELLVRAEVLDPDTGEFETTEWESATELEWTIVSHNPFPSRASRLSSNLHRRLNSAWNRLSEGQRQVIAEDFFGADDWTPMAERLASAAGGQISTDIETMIRADRVATGYASQFARARWGEGVTSVQYQLRRTPVPRWEERLEAEPTAPSATIREFGWRPVLTNDGQDDALFARTIERLER